MRARTFCLALAPVAQLAAQLEPMIQAPVALPLGHALTPVVLLLAGHALVATGGRIHVLPLEVFVCDIDMARTHHNAAACAPTQPTAPSAEHHGAPSPPPLPSSDTSKLMFSGAVCGCEPLGEGSACVPLAAACSSSSSSRCKMYSRPSSAAMRRAATPPPAAAFSASFTSSTLRLRRGVQGCAEVWAVRHAAWAAGSKVLPRGGGRCTVSCRPLCRKRT